MENNDLIGWVMAWLPKDSQSYNFDFFPEKSKYDCDLLMDDNWKKDISAQERAETELQLLKAGKIKRLGMEVVDGYVMPVYGKAMV